jgi:hypothetical protein
MPFGRVWHLVSVYIIVYITRSGKARSSKRSLDWTVARFPGSTRSFEKVPWPFGRAQGMLGSGEARDKFRTDLCVIEVPDSRCIA